MKYGRYLKEHQLAEWQRAYINYRALKKLISTAVASRASSLLQSQYRGNLGKGSPGSAARRSPQDGKATNPRGGGSAVASPRSVQTTESLPGDDAFSLPAAALDGQEVEREGPPKRPLGPSRTGSVTEGLLKPVRSTRHVGGTQLSTESARGTFSGVGGSSTHSHSVEGEGSETGDGVQNTASNGQTSDDSAKPLSPSGVGPSTQARPSPRFVGLGPRGAAPKLSSIDIPDDKNDDADLDEDDDDKKRPFRPRRSNKGKGPASPPIPASPAKSTRSGKSMRSPLALMGLGKGSPKAQNVSDVEQGLDGGGKPSGEGKRITWSPRLSRSKTSSSVGSLGRARWRFPEETPLPAILPHLNEPETAFFARLDEELEKVISFYDEREAEAVKRFEVLEKQLEELAQHRRTHKEHMAAHSTALSSYVSHPTNLVHRVRHAYDEQVHPDKTRPPKHRVGEDASRKEYVRQHMRRATDPDDGASDADDDIENDLAEDNQHGARHRAASHVAMLGRTEPYGAAKSKLKLACFEFYRFLSMLRQYRSLNRTGFSKICKKMEKNTRIPCSTWYLSNKVNPSPFVASTRLDELSRAIEDVFAKFFEHGNRKRALERLRVLGSRKTHHFTAWRAGVMMGLSVPVLVDGIIKSFHPDTRRAIPYWPSLMQLFAAELVPTFFACLFALNLLAYHRARINYVLIFEFDLRSVLDFRTFIEVPAFLLTALCYCWWLSISNFWPGHIEPKAWPMVWLVIALLTLMNPFGFYKKARFWMLRSLARVTTAGALRVEFRDFFLGDQLTSVYYAMYNIGFLICLYHRDWQEAPPRCSTNATWTSPILAALPNLWRLGQSLRRFVDSDGNKIHMLNAGKYTAGVLYFFFYFNWRIKGSQLDYTFALFIVFGTINSLATSTWDLIMDWNLFNRNAKHFLLRNELGYSDQLWFYYFAMIVDPIFRFGWVLYLPDPLSTWPHTPSVPLRGFVVTMAEVFRRFIWNFLRVESEHIGNVDGFRVTRDVPLPYTLAAIEHHSTAAGTGHGISDDEGEKPPAMERIRSLFRPGSARQGSDEPPGWLADARRALSGIDAKEASMKDAWKRTVAKIGKELKGKGKGEDSSSEEFEHEGGREHDHQGHASTSGSDEDRRRRGHGKEHRGSDEQVNAASKTVV